MLSILAAYLPYALVTAFTPGPNNIVALYAVSQKGWKGGKNVLLGMAVGFFCVMLVCAAFCYELKKYLPAMSEALKYIGAVYILWLAIHIARSKPDDEGSSKITFMQGFCLQFVNAKIILYAITIYTGYVQPYTNTVFSLVCNALFLTVIGVSGNMTWAAAGGILKRFLVKYYRPFNILMGFVLALCAAKMVI